MLVESLFGGNVDGEKIPMWIKIILIILIIIFVVPTLIIAILALIAFVYGSETNASAGIVKETFKGYDLA